MQYKIDPKTGKKIKFADDATSYITADGVDLSGSPTEWQADFTSAEAMQAAKLYHDIRWKKWLKNPKTGAAIYLSAEDIERKSVNHDGAMLSFEEQDIITGVGRAQTKQRGEAASKSLWEYLAKGEVAMYPWFVNDLYHIGRSKGINPDLLSWFPFPKGHGEKARKTVQIQNHYIVMYEGVGRRSKAERDMVWKAMTALRDNEVRDSIIENKVLSGLSRFVKPNDLKRLGYEEYLKVVPEAIRKNYADLDSGTIVSKTEPFMGFWQTVNSAIGNEVLSLILSVTGQDFDYGTALKEVERKANSGMMFQMSSEEIEQYRPKARIVFGIVLVIAVILMIKIIRQNTSSQGNSKNELKTGNVYNKWLAWGMVAPALALIALWSYYPLMKGMVMAFQNYKVAGESPFVGLDNFILLFLDKSFWMSMLRTVYFVFLNMLLNFTTPIILAILLTDVPRFKIFFRTLSFLPQMTSGLVIALLWEMMYDPTPEGFFNQMITLFNLIPFVDIPQQQWLQDPALAMICVIMPSVWASLGMGSLIYLAALSSLPRELYEAAEIDGASIFSKMKNITLPAIMPLIIINFVGAFINTFQGMGNIFLMTFGGPGEATTVVGMKIWIEAYANLRFSMATTMAWTLGAMLIGFTYFQIKFLGKLEFKRAK